LEVPLPPLNPHWPPEAGSFATIPPTSNGEMLATRLIQVTVCYILLSYLLLSFASQALLTGFGRGLETVIYVLENFNRLS